MGLTPDRMMELGLNHEAIELRQELDLLMDTLVEHPIYHWFPLRIRVEGREAVREMYERMRPMLTALAKVRDDQSREILALSFGEDQLACEIELPYEFPDGSIKTCRIAAFVPFVGDKMVGESHYLDSALAEELQRLLGPDFTEARLPGVSRLAELETVA